MTRYFFHLFEASVASRDEVGVEFPSVEAAFLDVHQAALEISQDMMRERRNIHHMRFEVCDEAGCVMFELPFAEVLDQTDHSRPAFEARRLYQRVRGNLRRNRRLSSDIASSMAEASERLRHLRHLLRGCDPAADSEPVEKR